MEPAVLVLMFAIRAVPGAAAMGAETVERWGIYEVVLKGPAEGNPYVDVELSATFAQGDRRFEPEGFYDGGGIYRIRFMPDTPGQWRYVTRSNCRVLDSKMGTLTCTKASDGNHGPVRVFKTFYFAHADGTPHFSVGTTCYAWVHQGDEMEEQTLATLRSAPFNKLRMCVFPKHYAYNRNEPEYYPFLRDASGKNDYSRFDPGFWRHFEKRVGDLLTLGIQADIIIFHPYDRWGYAKMDAETDERYLRYLIARLAAYRNVWWSLANEYDLMKAKAESDWDRFFQIVQKHDPYDHLRSIHNCRRWYDHAKPWVTHVSLQTSRFDNVDELRVKFGKPIVFDECRYEGDVPQGWGNLTPEQMTHHFWLGTMTGSYVGHGETYKHAKDLLWWSKGGVLRGQSPARIAFLKGIMAKAAFHELIPSRTRRGNYVLARPGGRYYVYFTGEQPEELTLAGSQPYKVETIDTWEMTSSHVNTAAPGEFCFAPSEAEQLLGLTHYTPGEKVLPQAKASANTTTGQPPLTVRFRAATDLDCHWEFGDGTESTERNPVHTYATTGLYRARLTVTDEEGFSGRAALPVAVEGPVDAPIVSVGFRETNTHDVTLPDGAIQAEDGTFIFSGTKPWKWVSVGKGPVKDLEGLRSFTITGWVKATDLKTGSGGNRIVFNLNHDRCGFDLVHLEDGRLRLAVNQWPDQIRNDSSAGKLSIGKWVFFAVTYDATRGDHNVRWFFGGENNPATRDRSRTYLQGPTGAGSGRLTVGNYNETLHRYGKDRQFRGEIRAIQIFGSRVGSSGALDLKAIREQQKKR